MAARRSGHDVGPNRMVRSMRQLDIRCVNQLRVTDLTYVPARSGDTSLRPHRCGLTHARRMEVRVGHTRQRGPRCTRDDPLVTPHDDKSSRVTRTRAVDPRRCVRANALRRSAKSHRSAPSEIVTTTPLSRPSTVLTGPSASDSEDRGDPSTTSSSPHPPASTRSTPSGPTARSTAPPPDPVRSRPLPSPSGTRPAGRDPTIRAPTGPKADQTEE